MYRFTRLMLVGMLLLGVVALLIPAAAQEGSEGGVVIASDFGSGADTLSPIYCTDTACADIIQFMFPVLVGVDPATATYQPNIAGALATDWTISEDNLVYTFTLRQDYFWSDGSPVTANDVALHWDIISNPEAQSPFAFLVDILDDVVALDDYTVQFIYKSADCVALGQSNTVAPIPAQVYGSVPAGELLTSPEGTAPSVTGGPMRFGEFRPSEQTTLLRDENWSDGDVLLDAFIVKVVPDQTVVVEQLLAGEINVVDAPPVNRRAEIRSNPDIQVYDYPGFAWDYMAMNLADPANPQSALDEAGNHIDQGVHPIFGDLAVRKAVAYAVDVDSLIDGAVFGEGDRQVSFLVPANWAYGSDLPFYDFDPDLADTTLAEAGWVDQDGDGVRECVSCTTAEPGTPLAFTLYTNQGNTRREAIGTIIQDQLSQIPNGGFAVEFQTIDFNTLLDIMDSQTFDAFILGWRGSAVGDPGSSLRQFFGPDADVPASGFNYTSYYNERINEIIAVANALPGCSQDERRPYYVEAQQIVADELPYLFMFVQGGFYAARSEVSGFDPYPSFLYWNIQNWTVQR